MVDAECHGSPIQFYRPAKKIVENKPGEGISLGAGISPGEGISPGPSSVCVSAGCVSAVYTQSLNCGF